MPSKRLEVLQALTVLLEAIEVAPGETLVGKVWRGRNRPGDESQVPFLNIFELPPDYEVRADRQVAKMPWFIGIQGYCQAGEPHLTDPAHELMALVKRQMGTVTNEGGGMRPPPEYMLGGLVDDIEVDGGMTFSPDETTDNCFFALKLTVTITDDLRNP